MKGMEMRSLSEYAGGTLTAQQQTCGTVMIRGEQNGQPDSTTPNGQPGPTTPNQGLLGGVNPVVLVVAVLALAGAAFAGGTQL